jgi:acyl-CoA thioesterase YciA
VEQPQGDLVIAVLAMPADTNPNGDMFGGWLVSHMDMGGGVAAVRCAKQRVVTAAIDEMEFIKPVYVGDTVACYAELLEIGHTSMRFKMAAWSKSYKDEHSKIVAHGIFTFVAVDDKGKPTPVKK